MKRNRQPLSYAHIGREFFSYVNEYTRRKIAEGRSTQSQRANERNKNPENEKNKIVLPMHSRFIRQKWPRQNREVLGPTRDATDDNITRDDAMVAKLGRPRTTRTQRARAEGKLRDTVNRVQQLGHTEKIYQH